MPRRVYDPPPEEVAEATIRAFTFLTDGGYEARIVGWPLWGFDIVFSRSGSPTIRITWVQYEFDVVASGGRVLFGRTHHPTFGGNMFSGSNLVAYLDRIAMVAQQALSPTEGPSTGAVRNRQTIKRTVENE